MSARKPDVWVNQDTLDCLEVVKDGSLWATYERDDDHLTPLYHLTDADLEAIMRAADELKTHSHYSGSNYQKRLAALAAALRSIADERK